MVVFQCYTCIYVAVQLKSLREALVTHLALMLVLRRPAAGGTPTRPLLKRPAAAGLQREQAVSPSMIPPATAKDTEVSEWYGLCNPRAQSWSQVSFQGHLFL